MWVREIPIVVRALGIIPKDLKKKLEEFVVRNQLEY